MSEKKCAVIVGVNSKLGEALCKEFATQGYSLGLVDWEGFSGDALVSACKSAGSPKCYFHSGNLSLPSTWK
jgi:NAD(P)-dependent dehydrogenase (short-subunit alcohol dehydrogenase family)